MQKPLVPGIRIVYVKDKFDPCKFSADFIPALGSPRSETFFTNKTVIELIETHFGKQFHENEFKIGGIDIIYDPKTGTGTWEYYGPYTHYGHLTDFFKKKGIAQELEKRVIERMKQEFRGLKRFIHPHPGNKRIEQMKKRGFSKQELLEGYSFRRAKRRLRAKIRRDKKKTATRQRRP